MQRTRPSNGSGGPADLEVRHTHSEGPALAHIHPGSIGSGWGITVRVLHAAPLSAHLVGAGALKCAIREGPPSAGAASAQRQATPSRPRPWWCVRGSGAPRHPKNTTSCLRSHQAISRQRSLGPQGSNTAVPGEMLRGRCGALNYASAPATILAPPPACLLF
ncbi:hypothetical protein NDU88_005271 [Pleurodeles waltl]|uniref:Uncharacterized protein n=1 Tax=Pleurodeles waltl TaxID=8319 RepID=A0AAV7PIE2_PLEWA|nr:hypothetical protein NDU88_005271 [Pleurodeles waltl]